MLTLANTSWGHDFVPQEIWVTFVDEPGLWRTADDIEIHARGENVYQAL